MTVRLNYTPPLGNHPCSTCKAVKDQNSFYYQKLKSGYRRSSRCKICNNLASKLHREANYEQKKADTRARYWRQREWIDELKNKPCMDCGGSFPPECMDFDHRDPTLKVERISELSRKLASKQSIVDEVAKCDLVCANCHRIRTKKQMRALDNRWSNLPLRKVG